MLCCKGNWLKQDKPKVKHKLIFLKKKSGDYSREEEVDWSKGVAPNLLQESSRSRRYNKQAKDRRGQGSKHSLTSVTRSYCIRLTVPEHVIRNLSRISSCHMLLLVGPVT